ncbi:zinc-dependent alcohol dehydrogenase [Carbonactinospora thermoautotrophica]|uniref:zinc-dependent alcohol dehydrogenase n=1 Tax=Carbonactinospora thermoautotrophica TaxID=1469144 RepID=UPI000ADA4C99|nr:alcohol dehydrogenase catalytic domain-containing protein [Carbonactinospora thermoautotrophica]
MTWPRGRMRAAVVAAPGRVELAELPIPEPLPGHALVRVDHVGVCGTDLELLHGTAAYVRDGRVRFPHVFGHEWSGTVVAAEGDPDGPAPGDRVVGQTMLACRSCANCQRGRRNLCLRLREVGLYGQQGAAAEYIRMPVDSLATLPPEVTSLDATLVEPAVTVVAALGTAGVGVGDRVAVVGTGTIGLLAVQLAARSGGHVHAVGVDPAGLELAAALGAETTYQPGAAPPDAYDVVVEASGAAAGFATALRLAATGGGSRPWGCRPSR